MARRRALHVQLALAIGALAPKLRLANILALRWTVEIDKAVTKITVYEHKTFAKTGKPLVVPIDPQLRPILTVAHDLQPAEHVVHWQGRPVKGIKTALKNAADLAGLVWGVRHDNGVCFHTLRHSMATWMAELEIPEKLRQAVMGHSDLRTTQHYTHLAARAEIKPLGVLSAATPLAHLVELPRPVAAGAAPEAQRGRPSTAAHHRQDGRDTAKTSAYQRAWRARQRQKRDAAQGAQQAAALQRLGGSLSKSGLSLSEATGTDNRAVIKGK